MTGLPFGRSFLPGPVDVHPDIQQAMLGPTLGWSGMGQLIEELEAPLRRIFGSVRPVLIGTCSATGFMEAAIRNGVRDRMLAVVGGYFGERFARVAEACGRHVVRAIVPPGETLTPEHLERFLQGPPVDAVSIVHSETSTGVLAPLADLAGVVRRHDDVMTLVDAVSSAGAVPISADLHHLDFVFTGTQKALGLPPGLALGVASPRMMTRARAATERGWYGDFEKLERQTREHFPTQTPALPLLYGLVEQMRRIEASGGLESRFAHHEMMARRVEQWVEQQPGVTLVGRDGLRTPTVSVLRLPERVVARDFIAAVASCGFQIASGLAPLTDGYVRIGHMGDLEMEHLDALLEVMSGVLRTV
ncbi:MAG TPA: aminotransferase class V-fold PLP-dependent enzyme [Gemmatimonadales bacterium]|nr:aminotransferase class V-fold PLP-dependent enzyme [Gemmatimonadales bacterium]